MSGHDSNPMARRLRLDVDRMGTALGRTLLAATVSTLAVSPGRAQRPASRTPAASPVDSADAHASAVEAQREFERLRTESVPVGYVGGCDRTFGRVCYHFAEGVPDVASDSAVEPERDSITEARQELLDVLAQAGARLPGDAWVLGQRVAYLGEEDEWAEGLALARDCRLAPPERWWCRALAGTALHYLGRDGEALAAFDGALADMPADIRSRWTDLSQIVDPGLRDEFRDEDPDSVSARSNRLWTLGDPLFLVPGHDRETEHYARWTLDYARQNVPNGYGLAWSGDLTEVLLRYGHELAYGWVPDPGTRPGTEAASRARGGGKIWGYRDARAWRTLPSAEQFTSPADVEPGTWRTDVRDGAGAYAAPILPLVGAIDLQRARFRRTDTLLVVMGWHVVDPELTAEPAPSEGTNGSVSRSLLAGLFMVPEHDLDVSEGDPRPGGRIELSPTSNAEGRHASLDGLATAKVPTGRYLVSLELIDPARQAAWRDRHGVKLAPRVPGVVELSDLLLLEPDASPDTERPDSADSAASPTRPPEDRLEDHLDRVVHGSVVPSGRVEVAWEVYGLSKADTRLHFRVRAQPEGRGLLRRVAEFLRLAGSQSVEVSWTEGADADNLSGVDSRLFRGLVVDLSSLSEGRTRLTLDLDIPGRTTITASTVFTIAP